ncbi:thioredoxin [Granulicoccus sp. GXG6511]|uniref:thioredoxin n=1 Tax=Granulicoccus sp. GXG6511 TaxID=3381351 RepID=UPI003D7D9083
MTSKVTPCPSCGTKNRVPAIAAGTPRCAKCQADLPWIADAGDRDYDEVADSSRVPVLVDLWAVWCGPCRQLSPLLEGLATERAGRLKLVKVNVDDSPETQARFGVQAIPTLLMFVDGKQVGEQRGALAMPALRAWVDSVAG